MEKLYRINPYTGRRETVAKDGTAIKNYWVLDYAGYRHFVRKGTKVDEYGMPEKKER